MTLNLNARIITADIKQIREHGDVGNESQVDFFLDLDDNNNLIIGELDYQTNPPTNYLSVNEVIDTLVTPIVDAMSK